MMNQMLLSNLKSNRGCKNCIALLKFTHSVRNQKLLWQRISACYQILKLRNHSTPHGKFVIQQIRYAQQVKLAKTMLRKL